MAVGKMVMMVGYIQDYHHNLLGIINILISTMFSLFV